MKGSNLDYESVLEEHQTLETSVSTMNESIDVLKSEIEKEEALLNKETKALQEMYKNAKSADAERKRQMKNEHPVLRELGDLNETQDGHSSEFTLADTQNNQIQLDDLDDDPEIQGLLKQLHGHLQSMQSNTAPLTGLSDALARSQAALDLYSND